MEEQRTPRLILLSEFLDQNKRKEDEIVILYDSKNGDEGVEEFLSLSILGYL